MFTHSIRKVLRGENPAQTLILVDDQHAIGALCSTELTSVRDGDMLGDGESWGRTERSDSPFANFWPCPAAFVFLQMRRGYRAFARELRLDFLAQRLSIHPPQLLIRYTML